MQGAFRSHLMQQFVAAARQQSRAPPMALAGWVGNEQEKNEVDSCDIHEANHKRTPTGVTTLDDIYFRRSDLGSYGTVEESEKKANRRGGGYFSSSPITDSSTRLGRSSPISTGFLCQDSQQEAENEGANLHFTGSLLSRQRERPPALRLEDYARAFDRAVSSAQHDNAGDKRMDAISFKRIPQDSLRHLSTILTATTKMPRRKSRPAACLVTLVEQEKLQVSLPTLRDNNKDVSLEPLPFVPLACARDLENYGAAYAASHNVLLSLRAQGIPCQLIDHSSSTMAMRRLSQATDTQRVVALIVALGH